MKKFTLFAAMLVALFATFVASAQDSDLVALDAGQSTLLLVPTCLGQSRRVKVLVNGGTVEVTYTTVNGKIKILDAWVTIRSP